MSHKEILKVIEEDQLKDVRYVCSSTAHMDVVLKQYMNAHIHVTKY